MLVGICKMFHTSLMPKKTLTEKYTIFKALRWFSIAVEHRLKHMFFYYFIVENYVYVMLIILLPKSVYWIAILVFSAFCQTPYLLANLTLKEIDAKTTLDTFDLRYRYRFDLGGNIFLSIVLATLQASSKSRQEYSPISMIASCLIFSAVMIIAIWLINGGGKRLYRRLKRRLNKLWFRLTPRLRLRPVGSS